MYLARVLLKAAGQVVRQSCTEEYQNNVTNNMCCLQCFKQQEHNYNTIIVTGWYFYKATLIKADNIKNQLSTIKRYRLHSFRVSDRGRTFIAELARSPSRLYQKKTKAKTKKKKHLSTGVLLILQHC